MAGVDKKSEPKNDLSDLDDDEFIDSANEPDADSIPANHDKAEVRRRLEDYMEERRLRSELEDDFDE
ncbi:MAG: hypothetical protein OEY00_00665 [Gammaproteobacteria bacterium]|nr:hypothetical protein [Gammaproteobacteria bacterium]